MVMGLMLGLGLAFFIEYLDNTIKSPEEVEHYFKIPLAGSCAGPYCQRTS